VPGTALLIEPIGLAGNGLVNLTVSFSLSLVLASYEPVALAEQAEDGVDPPASKTVPRTSERGPGR
jgi:hypothetical protein